MIRRFFWDFKDAFVGIPMMKLLPKVPHYPVLIGVPLYTFIVA